MVKLYERELPFYRASGEVRVLSQSGRQVLTRGMEKATRTMAYQDILQRGQSYRKVYVGK